MKKNTENIIFCALFTAIIAVCAQISIPTPLFILTLQSFGIALCGYTMGVKNTAYSVSAYILLGILGAPVFDGFCGGFHHITEPAGGFIIGFLPFALLCAISHKLKGKFKKIGIGVLAAAVLNVFGVIHFCINTGTNIINPAVLIFAVTFVKDTLSVVLAYYLSGIVKKRIMI